MKRGRSRVPLMVVERRGNLRRVNLRRRAGRPPSVKFPVVVEFARGSTTPRIECLRQMHQCAQWLARHPRERATVVGHANDRGWTPAAKSLARERVAAVVALLELLGAGRKQLVTLSATRLHSASGTTRGERQQKRVVVIHHHDAPQVVPRVIASRIRR